MQIIRKPPVDNEVNIVEQIKFRYLPYWPLFLALIIVFVGVAWLYTKFQTPVYDIGAKVMIKDEKKGAEDSKTLEELNLISPKKIVENEIEVIQSKPVISKVVKDLNLYAPIYSKNIFGKRSAYLTSPILIKAMDADSIKPTKEVAFEYNYSANTVSIAGVSYSLDKWFATPYGKLQFIKNGNYDGTSQIPKFVFELVPTRVVANGISGDLKVEVPNKLATVVTLNYKDEVPQRGEKVLNGIIDAYNNALVTEKGDLAFNTLSFIDERLKTVKNSLDSIESQKQQYRTQRNSVDIGAQGQMYLDNVGRNDQKLSEINMQLSVLNGVENYVRTKETSGKIVPSTMGVNDPVLSTLVNNLYQTELEYDREKQRSGENNPATLALADQLNKMRPSIVENINSQKRNLQQSRNTMSSINGNYAAMLRAIPETERQLVEIDREQKIESGIYTFLLQKREEAALSQISKETNSRIIDHAESSQSPVSPKKKLIYLSALLIALFLGIGVVLAKEKAGNKIMFRSDIETLTELPIIGEIAAESSKNPIVIDDRRKTVIAEQFRKLRVTLGYIGVNSKHKRILVTSSISGEGKSFVATNLAISLAITGKKVLLLDFDLNNPSLNNKLNINEQKGITDYLLGEETDLNNLIMKMEVNENLYLLPTGKLPHNPSELLMSDAIENMMNKLDNEFDYLVIDTAPVVPVTDAYILSKHCDATLFIVRHNYSPKVLVEIFDYNNKMNNLKNAAIVFNGVKPRGFGKKSYTYGYGYTSGYQYSNGYIQEQNTRLLKEK